MSTLGHLRVVLGCFGLWLSWGVSSSEEEVCLGSSGSGCLHRIDCSQYQGTFGNGEELYLGSVEPGFYMNYMGVRNAL